MTRRPCLDCGALVCNPTRNHKRCTQCARAAVTRYNTAYQRARRRALKGHRTRKSEAA